MVTRQLPGYSNGIDLVVTQFHTPDYLQACLDSIVAAGDTTPLRLHLVNVEATEAEATWADRFFETLPPKMRGQILNPARNIGQAAACNLALARPDNWDTFFFVNADCTVSEGAIDHLYATLWSDERYGCVGPRQIDSEGRITAAGVFGTNGRPAQRCWHDITDEYQDLREDCITISGAMYMIKRSVWDEMASCPIYKGAHPQAQGAMPNVFHYFNETWLSYHMRSHGHLCVFDGRVTCVHEWHKSSPIGGWGEQKMPHDLNVFRRLCDAHGLGHE